MLLYIENRLGGVTLPALEKDTAITYPYRTVNFNSSTSNVVVFYMPQNGCLRVLDPARGHTSLYDNIADSFTQAIPLSDPSRILVNPAQPAQPMFFSEPKPDWCYYFTRVELSNQQGDYPTAAAWAQEALTAGFSPEDPREWLVFIEAYALNEDIDQAVQLSQTVLTDEKKMLKAVCTVWEQIQAKAPESGAEGVKSARLRLGCNP